MICGHTIAFGVNQPVLQRRCPKFILSPAHREQLLKRGEFILKIAQKSKPVLQYFRTYLNENFMYINFSSQFASKFLVFAAVGLLITSGSIAQNGPMSHQTTKTNASVQMENMNGTTITLGGKTVHTVGKLPVVGANVKAFTLTGIDLQERTFADYKGKYVIMNIFPSVNTGTCSKSVRKFNEEAAALTNTTVLCISKDLPFAQKQFCGAEGIDRVVMLSDFRNDFGNNYGVLITDGPMRGLLSRAVVVINPEGKIVYEEQVPEIGHEPNYAAAKAAIK